MIQSGNLCVPQTIQWVREFVIKLNLCPFAKREMDKGSVSVSASSAETVEQAMIDFMVEIELLNLNADIETTLLVFPALFSEFFDYLDFVDVAEATLQADGYEGVYQLATFHPDYCFAGTTPDDVSNYTNRSPHPMVHLLREERIEKAIAYYGDTAQIYENNMACLRALGLNQVKKMLLLSVA